jgi:oxygen-independent coproporphyrinogen-3 oxidase
MKRILADGSAIDEAEPLSEREHAIERLIFGLRMVDGIEIAGFEEASGASLESLVGRTIDELIGRGLLERTETFLRLTPEGRMVADAVAVELL